MENQTDDKTFTWLIKNFLSIKAETVYSDRFRMDGCRWRLLANPRGDNCNNYLSLYVSVPDARSLPSKWKKQAHFCFTVVNHLSEERSCRRDGIRCFERNKYVYGFSYMLPLSQIYAKDSGFLVNGDLKILAELKVVGSSDKINVSQEPEDAGQLAKRMKLDDSSSVKKNIDINGFEVCSSQVDLVKHIFQKHPDIDKDLLFNDQGMKTASMNVLITLIKTLCKPLTELTDKKLMEANTALTMVKSSGFKVEWLEKKLEEVKAKKKEQQESVDQMKEMEGVLEFHKKKCAELEAILETEKAKVVAARERALTFEEVI